MKRFSIFQSLLLSFHSREVYRLAARSGRGAGLLQTLLLALITTALVTIKVQTGVARIADREAPPVLAQVPTITIRAGRVSVDVETPLVIRTREGRVLAVIDTASEAISLAGSEARMMLTRDRLMFRTNATETRVFDLSRVQSLVVDRAQATRWVRIFATWCAPVLFPFVLIGLYVARLVQQLIGALVALPIARSLSLGPDFGATMRLAALAITPPTLALDLLGFAGVHLPFSGGLWCVVALLYVLFGVRSLREVPAEPGIGDADAPAH
jgi:hypothetical protein